VKYSGRSSPNAGLVCLALRAEGAGGVVLIMKAVEDAPGTLAEYRLGDDKHMGSPVFPGFLGVTIPNEFDRV
jgi:hypothetical protein